MTDHVRAENHALWRGWVVGGIGLAAVVAGVVLSPDFVAANIVPDGTLEPIAIRTISALRTLFLFVGLLLTVCSALFLVNPARFSSFVKQRLELQTNFFDQQGRIQRALSLFLISFLGLYFEILVIRWLSTELRVFAYFTNFPLMACFLGLGLGFVLVNRFRHLQLAFPILFCLFLSLVIVATVAVPLLSYPGSSEEYIWGLKEGPSLHSLVFYGVILFFFFFNVVCFIPLGYLTGRLMNSFAPLEAYSVNIVGSLVGVWAFSAISFFNFTPIVWFAVGFVLFLWLVRGERFFLLGTAALFGACMIFLAYFLQPAYWSPYYRIDVWPVKAPSGEGRETLLGYRLDVNQDYHQNIINLSPSFVSTYKEKAPILKSASFAYNVIYELFPAEDVLIVGAGTGNDVAAALRHGVKRIDAVEIDPVILDLGGRLHPELPYKSDRVRLVNEDARSYFKKTQRKYDIIVYGLLDSHALFSSMSNLRLDNYVYTLESFEEARNHLKENGVIALTFSVWKEWIAARIANMLEEVFHEEPLCFETDYDNGIMFVAGPGLNGLRNHPPPDVDPGIFSSRVIKDILASPAGRLPLTTDDWPYLYLKEKRIPVPYLKMLAITLGLSLVLILLIIPESKRISPPFFFLGSAFLLIEFKSITDMALMFGSTWLVNSFVISCILLMILGANYAVSRFEPKKLTLVYALLGLALLLNYLIPVSSFLEQSLLVRGMLGGAFLSLPIFFAGIIFATLLKRFPRIEIAFGSNLLGAVIGGLLEYSSLIYGLRNLFILAGLLYALSYIFYRRTAILR